ncbi:MAG: deoxynucleoside kinase [Gammaproteobacteria bacterium]|nr:deoxynucleoside kinase [Gammaproteobacteria bacterium]
MSTASPGYIVVEGPIGVGKTSLAQRLADAFDARPLLERPEENPFLERFYAARKHFALPTQLFFLFQRVRQIQELKQGDMFNTSTVADFLMDKDRLFARVNLDDDELRLYEQVHGQMNTDWPAPDLVIYLQAPIDVLMERLRRRDIPYERMIERNYLKSLVDAYTQYFYHYTAAPLLMVNASEINFVDSEADFDMLLAHIRKIKTGRHFFNPLKAEL